MAAGSVTAPIGRKSGLFDLHATYTRLFGLHALGKVRHSRFTPIHNIRSYLFNAGEEEHVAEEMPTADALAKTSAIPFGPHADDRCHPL